MNRIYIIGSVHDVHTASVMRSLVSYHKSIGNEVVCVKPEVDKKTMEELIMECYNNIDNADIIIAVSKSDGDYGVGTTYELLYAKHIGKTVQYC